MWSVKLISRDERHANGAWVHGAGVRQVGCHAGSERQASVAVSQNGNVLRSVKMSSKRRIWMDFSPKFTRFQSISVEFSRLCSFGRAEACLSRGNPRARAAAGTSGRHISSSLCSKAEISREKAEILSFFCKFIMKCLLNPSNLIFFHHFFISKPLKSS